MSNKSNNQGRAYEFICLLSLYEAIKQIRNANIIENSSYEAAHKAWNTLKPSEQALYTLSAKSTIDTIFSLEPNIIEEDEDILNLFIQTDKHGENADVRVIIIERKDIRWEIGLSIKHNHTAVKHSRLSASLDFWEKWYGVKCSQNYWEATKPVFNFLKEKKKTGILFEELNDKEETVYVPLLKAFINEVSTQIKQNSSIPRKMVEYLLSKYDFYKVISIDKKRITTIQSFNMYGTLNQASKVKEPDIRVPLINLPSELLHIGFKPNHKNTVIMCFDNGWQFSFRVHNAEKHVTPSLKFDIQIEGMPVDINIKFNCTWKNENN